MNKGIATFVGLMLVVAFATVSPMIIAEDDDENKH